MIWLEREQHTLTGEWDWCVAPLNLRFDWPMSWAHFNSFFLPLHPWTHYTSMLLLCYSMWQCAICTHTHLLLCTMHQRVETELAELIHSNYKLNEAQPNCNLMIGLTSCSTWVGPYFELSGSVQVINHWRVVNKSAENCLTHSENCLTQNTGHLPVCDVR